jgi:hypothetical protein
MRDAECLRLCSYPFTQGEMMAINIPLQNVVHPQFFRTVVGGGTGFTNPDGSDGIRNTVMDIYTGWIVFDFNETHDTLIHEHVFSFIPLGPGSGGNVTLQNYTGGAGAIVSASISSFGRRPAVAAVDFATIKLVTHSFSGVLPAQVLLLDASVAVQDGSLHRIAYQVTAIAGAKEPPKALQELSSNVLSIPQATTPA